MRQQANKLLVPLTAALLFFGACNDEGSGGSSDSTSASTSKTGNGATSSSIKPGERGPVVAGKFSFSGALDLSGTYNVSYPLNDKRLNRCDSIAGSDATGYVVPSPSFSESFRFAWVAAVTEYRGPGSYSLADLKQFSIEVRSAPDAEPVRYAAAEGAAATLEVDKGNTGSYKFSGLTSSDGGKLSGSLTWSCS